MARFIASRILWSLVAVFIVVTANFVIVRSVPGDPVDALIGDYPAPPGYVEEVRAQFGLDQPILAQLWLYLQQLLQGNFGYSFANNQAVLPLLLERASATLTLMLPGLILASTLGVLLGAAAARRAGTFVDSTITAFSLVGFSMPVFWLGQLLMLLFAVNLGWLPAQGAGIPAGDADPLAVLLSRLQHMALPVLCITLFYMTVITRVSRAAVASSLSQDYIKSALAQGLSERYVLWRHAVRSATGPIVTVIGFNFGSILTGAVLTETVFAWPGLGSLFIQAINSRDYPVVQGVFVLTGIAVVLANLFVDVITALLDPRVRAATFASRRRSPRTVVTLP